MGRELRQLGVRLRLHQRRRPRHPAARAHGQEVVEGAHQRLGGRLSRRCVGDHGRRLVAVAGRRPIGVQQRSVQDRHRRRGVRRRALRALLALPRRRGRHLEVRDELRAAAAGERQPDGARPRAQGMCNPSKWAAPEAFPASPPLFQELRFGCPSSTRPTRACRPTRSTRPTTTSSPAPPSRRARRTPTASATRRAPTRAASPPTATWPAAGSPTTT